MWEVEAEREREAETADCGGEGGGGGGESASVGFASRAPAGGAAPPAEGEVTTGGGGPPTATTPQTPPPPPSGTPSAPYGPVARSGAAPPVGAPTRRVARTTAGPVRGGAPAGRRLGNRSSGRNMFSAASAATAVH